MLDDIKKDAVTRMGKCVTQFQADLKKMRTGRAHPSLIEHLKVDYYGSDVPLQQVASIAVEDGRTLVVSPWEKGMVQPIEKAIHKSDLGLNPMTAGTIIRIPMPPLTEERRREFTKVIRQDAEGARVAVRNVRRDVMSDIKEALKDKLISQDDERRAETDIQKLTDKHVADIDQMLGGQGKGDHAGLIDLHEREPAPSCGDHHGRQRPLGCCAETAAACWPQGRHQRPACLRANVHGPRYRGAHGFRILQ